MPGRPTLASEDLGPRECPGRLARPRVTISGDQGLSIAHAREIALTRTFAVDCVGDGSRPGHQVDDRRVVVNVAAMAAAAT